jgi:hypothetical protein
VITAFLTTHCVLLALAFLLLMDGAVLAPRRIERKKRRSAPYVEFYKRRLTDAACDRK